MQKQLISQLSPVRESKSVFVSERGLTSTQWSEYSENTKRIQYSSVPTSDITAEAVTVDGFTLSQKDSAGIVTTAMRSYTATGMLLTLTDGRGNTTSTITDIAGRTTSVTDAAHANAMTVYDSVHDQPVATRPLAIQKDGTWYTYGWDLTKNICELYGQHGYIRTAYTYSPYGQVTAEGDVEQSPRGFGGGLDKPRSEFAPQGRAGNGVPASQPIQWSSEFNDTELGLIYYNYRHYNPVDGRWIGRDVIFNKNPYCYVYNTPVYHLDICGAIAYIPILVGVLLSLGAVYGINSYLTHSRHRAGHVRIYAPDYFGYDENISAFWEKVNKHRDLYTGHLLYDFNVFDCSEFQEVIQIIENRSDEKCIRKLVLAAHGKASPKDESDFEASMEFGSESLTETNISDMFEGIKFCSPCHLELRVCHIGKSQKLANSLKEKYPCTITMYDTYVKP